MRYSYVPESAAGDAAFDPFTVAREPFPEPWRASRDPWPNAFSIPNPALLLAEFAREHSWEVRTQYSQGHVPHATTGKPNVLKDLIALRFGAHPMTDRQAYAVYSRPATQHAGTWAWSSVMIWGPDLPPFAGCGVTELRAYLIMCADSSAEGLAMWVADLKSIRENAAKLRAERPKPAPKPREGMR